MQCVSHFDPFHFSLAIPNFLGTPTIETELLRAGPLDFSNLTMVNATPPTNTTSAAGHLHGKKNRNILFNTEGRAQHGRADQVRPTWPITTKCYVLKRLFQFVQHLFCISPWRGCVETGSLKLSALWLSNCAPRIEWNIVLSSVKECFLMEFFPVPQPPLCSSCSASSPCSPCWQPDCPGGMLHPQWECEGPHWILWKTF